MSEALYDYLIIGSGFGGAVSAYRLAQKGYRVCLVEAGDHAPAKEAHAGYDAMEYREFKHIRTLSGSGVGGGSLIFAGVLSEPKPSF